MRPGGVSLSHHPPSLPLPGQQAAAQTPGGVQQGEADRDEWPTERKAAVVYCVWPLLHSAMESTRTGLQDCVFKSGVILV